MILQLSPPIPVQILARPGATWPSGHGQALALIDYSPEHYTLWKVALDSDGQIWDIPQNYIRLQENQSLGRLCRRMGD